MNTYRGRPTLERDDPAVVALLAVCDARDPDGVWHNEHWIDGPPEEIAAALTDAGWTPPSDTT